MMTRSKDLVDEKMNILDAISPNDEVLVERKTKRPDKQVQPLKKHDNKEVFLRREETMKGQMMNGGRKERIGQHSSFINVKKWRV